MVQAPPVKGATPSGGSVSCPHLLCSSSAPGAGSLVIREGGGSLLREDAPSRAGVQTVVCCVREISARQPPLVVLWWLELGGREM